MCMQYFQALHNYRAETEGLWRVGAVRLLLEAPLLWAKLYNDIHRVASVPHCSHLVPRVAGPVASSNMTPSDPQVSSTKSSQATFGLLFRLSHKWNNLWKWWNSFRSGVALWGKADNSTDASKQGRVHTPQLIMTVGMKRGQIVSYQYHQL